MCGRNLRFPTHAPSLFCDTIQFAIETDLSCHRQGPGAGSRSGLFLCPKFALPPAKSKLTALPTGFPKTALPESVPQSGTPQLFSIHVSRPGLPVPLPGSAIELLSAGGRRISSPAAIRNCKTPFPPHSPACRAQAHSEPVPQSGTPQLFSILSSLAPLRPSPPTSREGQRTALRRG